MNSIVTLPKLIDLLAQETKVDKATAAEFLKAFIAVAADTLARGESLKVKDIGTFDPVGGKKGVDFTPEPALAEAINAPFSVFIPVPLNDGVTEEMLDAASPTPEPAPEAPAEEPAPEAPAEEPAPEAPAEEPAPEAPAEEPAPKVPAEEPAPEAPAEEPAPEVPAEESAPEVPAKEPAPEAPAEEPAPEVPAEEPAPEVPAEEPAPAYYDDEDEEPRSSGRGLWIVVALVIGALLGFLGGYLMHDTVQSWVAGAPIPPSPMDSIAAEGEILIAEAEAGDTAIPADSTATDEAATPEKTDSAEDAGASELAGQEPAEKAEPQGERYEISRAGRYLSKMGREYYGDEAYWIYIYKENRDKISNPSNFPAGLKIMIPPFEKYKTSDDPEQNLRDAKAEGNAVYKKYGII